MRRMIKNYVSFCAANLPLIEPIYEFGALQVEGQEKIANLRSLFKNKKYVGADIRLGTGVDVVLDLHSIDLPNESVGTVLLLETLEHVEFPRKAIDEIHRILKPNGILIMSSVFVFPIHNYPSDYWRFTPEAFKSLLRPFASSFVDYAGQKNVPHSIVGLGFKGDDSHVIREKFVNQYIESKPLKSGWKEIAMLATPAYLWPFYLKLNNLIQHKFK